MPSFEEWMREIDAILLEEIGVCHDDLPDQLYYDHYQDDMTPRDVVDEIILDELMGEF